MRNWKESSINVYIALEVQKQAVALTRAEDKDLKKARLAMETAVAQFSALEESYNTHIEELNTEIEGLHTILQRDWDIEEKTYECEAGSITIRTTKSLHVADKKQLMESLLNLGKLPESIRSWNLSYLRKLKDVDLIPDNQAYYEEHQNVVIKGAMEK